MKKFFLFFIPSSISVAPVFAFAQATISISSSVPGMAVTASTTPGQYVQGFYSFALMIGGVLAFGAIVYGGILYAASGGNPGQQSEGKEWVKSALLGLLLLAVAYLILYTVNPNLVNLNLPTLSAINVQAPTGSGNCQAPASGPCSISSFQGSSCFSDSQVAQTAAGVCNAESSDNANAQGDQCDDGSYASIGLFQINLSANTIQDPTTGETLNCPSAFSQAYTGSSPHCVVLNQSLYDECLAAAENPSTNVQTACSLSQNGTNWNLWGPATKQACGL